MLHPKPSQSRRRKNRPVKILLPQFLQTSLYISTNPLKGAGRIERLHLQGPPSAGSAYHAALRDFRCPRLIDEYIPRILPHTVSHHRKLLRDFCRHILQTMHRQINPAVKQRPVQLLDKQSLSPDKLQTLIQYLVPCRLHGHQLHLYIRVSFLNGLSHDFRLYHCQPALPAPYSDDRLHGASIPFSSIS